MASDQLSLKRDPIAWWKMQRLVYPTLSILAAEFLATPATSVQSERVFFVASVRSERVFSVAGYTVNKQDAHCLQKMLIN